MSGKKAGILMCWLIGAASFTASGAEIALLPTRATGEYTISGNEIVLENGGQQVFLEIYLSGWDPDLDGTPEMRAWQADIDSSGYSNDLGGRLTPWMLECTGDADCEAVMGPLGVGAAKGGCAVPGSPAGFCAAGFIDDTRSDYVFAGLAELSIVDLVDYRFGAALLGDPLSDPGTPRYAGTLVLDVPLDAHGIFSVGFLGWEAVGLFDEDGHILPLHLTPAQIIINCETSADCNDYNACTRDVCGTGNTCTAMANYDPRLYCCYPADGTLCDKPAGLPGDFDGDGGVDLADFARFQTCFGSGPLEPACTGVDMDCDCAAGDQDVADFISALTGPVD